jgi:hypothetical protein
VSDDVVWRGVTGVDEDRAAGVGWRLLSASLGVRHLRHVDQHPSGTAGEVLSLLCHNILLFVVGTHLHTYMLYMLWCVYLTGWRWQRRLRGQGRSLVDSIHAANHAVVAAASLFVQCDAADLNTEHFAEGPSESSHSGAAMR